MTVIRDGAEAPRARLLALAEDQIRREGLVGLSVVRIARAAGMTHANVYRYFASKSVLAEEAATAWLRPIEQRLNDITQAPDPAVDKLERFLTLLARAYEDKAREDSALFSVFAAHVPGRHRQRVRELLARIVEEGLSIRTYTEVDVQRVESLILDAMHRFIDPASVLATTLEQGRTSQLEARRDRVVRLLIRGLGAGREV